MRRSLCTASGPWQCAQVPLKISFPLLAASGRAVARSGFASAGATFATFTTPGRSQPCRGAIEQVRLFSRPQAHQTPAW